ncbi:hypothetical protein QT381_01445 [Galbitalea sp. SE-J8]|uniref:hypothetical protein n=1 Tax=Galbitalea sp. SE-J8 TaxID=3054952 RepID=UPI00259C96FE|nr:hypothetical protein [Galbitalea sp. SE-J8]MDM4761669.1 hypothetical protein [Galbitalea sp. SE-J8]
MLLLLADEPSGVCRRHSFDSGKEAPGALGAVPPTGRAIRGVALGAAVEHALQQCRRVAGLSSRVEAVAEPCSGVRGRAERWVIAAR